MRLPKEFNVPNFLTIIRFFLGFVFFYFLVYGNMTLAIFIFIIAVITDGLDGLIARRYGTVTKLGKFLDGLSDKLFMILIVLGIVLIFNVPLVYILMILTRDILVTIGVVLILIRAGSWKSIKKLEFSSRKLGKITTFLQIIAILMVFFEFSYFNMIAYIISVVGLLAVVDYYFVWKEQVKLD